MYTYIHIYIYKCMYYILSVSVKDFSRKFSRLTANCENALNKSAQACCAKCEISKRNLSLEVCAKFEILCRSTFGGHNREIAKSWLTSHVDQERHQHHSWLSYVGKISTIPSLLGPLWHADPFELWPTCWAWPTWTLEPLGGRTT